MRHFQNFDKIDNFLKPVLNICKGEVSGLSKRGLVFSIKSIDSVEVLIFGGVGFIKVRVSIIRTLPDI